LGKGILAGIGAILVVVVAIIASVALRGDPEGQVAVLSPDATATIGIPTLKTALVDHPGEILGVIGSTPISASTQVPAQPAVLSSPTETVAQLSPTLQPTTGSVASAVPLPCSRAAAGNPLDVSVPPGTRLQPGEAFVKTWRVQNTGSCTWTSQYSLVFVTGEQMTSQSQVAWSSEIPPGGTLEVSVDMAAPSTPGLYQSEWLLRSPTGETFGLGANGSMPLVARIEVAAAARATPTATPPTTGSLIGRVLLNGVPAVGVSLRLEDRVFNVIASLQTGSDGTFTFSNIPAYADGYSLVFAQEANAQLSIDQIVSWAWIGPVPLVGGSVVQLPDFEIGYAGLAPLGPAPDSSSAVSAISQANPLLFEWSPYPGAGQYWVDLVMGEEQAPVWQSPYVQGTTAAFDGTLFGGAFVQPGDYWWAVGARKPVGAYNQTVYTYLVGFTLEP
jgi:hypothetical protein